VDESSSSDIGRITYTAVLTPGDDGFVCAQIAEVPEAISQGRTLEEAKANVVEALELALEWRRDEGETLPATALVSVVPVTVAAA
jgi:predicted RNase H-like HicB family nuclease